MHKRRNGLISKLKKPPCPWQRCLGTSSQSTSVPSYVQRKCLDVYSSPTQLTDDPGSAAHPARRPSELVQEDGHQLSDASSINYIGSNKVASPQTTNTYISTTTAHFTPDFAAEIADSSIPGDHCPDMFENRLEVAQDAVPQTFPDTTGHEVQVASTEGSSGNSTQTLQLATDHATASGSDKSEKRESEDEDSERDKTIRSGGLHMSTLGIDHKVVATESEPDSEEIGSKDIGDILLPSIASPVTQLPIFGQTFRATKGTSSQISTASRPSSRSSVRAPAKPTHLPSRSSLRTRRASSASIDMPGPRPPSASLLRPPSRTASTSVVQPAPNGALEYVFRRIFGLVCKDYNARTAAVAASLCAKASTIDDLVSLAKKQMGPYNTDETKVKDLLGFFAFNLEISNTDVERMMYVFSI